MEQFNFILLLVRYPQGHPIQLFSLNIDGDDFSSGSTLMYLKNYLIRTSFSFISLISCTLFESLRYLTRPHNIFYTTAERSREQNRYILSFTFFHSRFLNLFHFASDVKKNQLKKTGISAEQKIITNHKLFLIMTDNQTFIYAYIYYATNFYMDITSRIESNAQIQLLLSVCVYFSLSCVYILHANA